MADQTQKYCADCSGTDAAGTGSGPLVALCGSRFAVVKLCGYHATQDEQIDRLKAELVAAQERVRELETTHACHDELATMYAEAREAIASLEAETAKLRGHIRKQESHYLEALAEMDELNAERRALKREVAGGKE